MAQIKDENGNVTGHICFKKDIYHIDNLYPSEVEFKKLSLGEMLKIVFRKIFKIKD